MTSTTVSSGRWWPGSLSGADLDEVVSFLRDKVETHFGLDSVGIDIAGFATETVAWWRDGESQSTA